MPYAQSAPKRTVLPTLPVAALSNATAVCTWVALEPLVAAPPAMASAGLPRPNASAMPSMVWASTPVSSATFLTSIWAATPAYARSARPRSMRILSTARASAASVPGALRTHWSALAAVSDWRGSTWM